MNRAAFADSLVDPGRLATVAVIAALVVILDVTVLDLVGIRTTTDAVAQFVVITVGAYIGMTLVDVVFGLDARGSDD